MSDGLHWPLKTSQSRNDNLELDALVLCTLSRVFRCGLYGWDRRKEKMSTSTPYTVIQINCLEYSIVVPCTLKGIEAAEKFLDSVKEFLEGDVKNHE